MYYNYDKLSKEIEKEVDRLEEKNDKKKKKKNKRETYKTDLKYHKDTSQSATAEFSGLTGEYGEKVLPRSKKWSQSQKENVDLLDSEQVKEKWEKNKQTGQSFESFVKDLIQTEDMQEATTNMDVAGTDTPWLIDWYGKRKSKEWRSVVRRKMTGGSKIN